jgi:hypothetical protein
MNGLEYELTVGKELEMGEWLAGTQTHPGMKMRIDGNPSLLEITMLWINL